MHARRKRTSTLLAAVAVASSPALGQAAAPGFLGRLSARGLTIQGAAPPPGRRIVVTVLLPGVALDPRAYQPARRRAAVTHLCRFGPLASPELPETPLRRHLVVETASATLTTARGAPMAVPVLATRGATTSWHIPKRGLPSTNQPLVETAEVVTHDCAGEGPPTARPPRPARRQGTLRVLSPADTPLYEALGRAGFVWPTTDTHRPLRFGRPGEDIRSERLDMRTSKLLRDFGGSRVLRIGATVRERGGKKRRRAWTFAVGHRQHASLARAGTPRRFQPTPFGLQVSFPEPERVEWMLLPDGRPMVWLSPPDDCGEGDEGELNCSSAVATVLTAHRAEQVAHSDPAGAWGPRSQNCDGALSDCLAGLDVEHWMLFLDEVVAARARAREPEGRAWDLLRFRVEGHRLGTELRESRLRPPFVLRFVAPAREIRDQWSRSVLSRAPEGEAYTEYDDAEVEVFHPVGRLLERPWPLGQMPWIVCADQVLQPEHLRPLKPRTRTWGALPMLVYFRASRYELPCAPELVFRGDVEGLVSGPLPPIEPPHILSINPTCPMSSEPYRGCELAWYGDMNGDGRADAMLRRYGESGCGEETLHISHPEGYRVAASWSWFCL